MRSPTLSSSPLRDKNGDRKSKTEREREARSVVTVPDFAEKQARRKEQEMRQEGVG